MDEGCRSVPANGRLLLLLLEAVAVADADERRRSPFQPWPVWAGSLGISYNVAWQCRCMSVATSAAIGMGSDWSAGTCVTCGMGTGEQSSQDPFPSFPSFPSIQAHPSSCIPGSYTIASCRPQSGNRDAAAQGGGEVVNEGCVLVWCRGHRCQSGFRLAMRRPM